MSAAESFGSPDPTANDYYERLGAPTGADADDIDDHTKKYVAEFKPELSDHENAEERWSRFNAARQTLGDPDEKEQYDVFRERFGPETGADAYETWQARDRPKSPRQVDPVRDLGLDPADAGGDVDADTGTGTETGTDTDTDTDGETTGRSRRERTGSQGRDRARAGGRSRGSSAAETAGESTAEGRTGGGRADAGTSAGAGTTAGTGRGSEDGTFSTRADAGAETSTGETVDGGFGTRLVTELEVFVTEATTVLSGIEYFVAAYLAYAVVVQFGAAAVAGVGGGTLRDAVTVATVFGIGYMLYVTYIGRFVADDPDRPVTPPGRQAIESLDTPRSALFAPAGLGLLLTAALLTGGDGVVLFLLGVTLLSTYGRFRVVRSLVSLPSWSRYVAPVGGLLSAVAFLVMFVASAPDTSLVRTIAGLDAPLFGTLAVCLVLALLLPVVATLRGGDDEDAGDGDDEE